MLILLLARVFSHMARAYACLIHEVKRVIKCPWTVVSVIMGAGVASCIYLLYISNLIHMLPYFIGIFMQPGIIRGSRATASSCATM